MDLVELARQFGQEIQNDDMYINLRIAEQNLETDSDFQKLMSAFNECKMKINYEMSKSSPDQEVIKSLNISVEENYKQILQNPNMISYQRAQKEFMDVMKRVNSIIAKSAQGEDPYTADYDECTGSCSECGGCH